MKRNGILFLTKYPDTMKCHTVHKSVCRHFKTCQIPWERKPRNPSPSFSLVPCNTALLMVCGPAHWPYLRGLHSASPCLHLLKSTGCDLFPRICSPKESFLFAETSSNPGLQVWTRPSKLHKTSTSRTDRKADKPNQCQTHFRHSEITIF